jgi:hypothetical protein
MLDIINQITALISWSDAVTYVAFVAAVGVVTMFALED